MPRSIGSSLSTRLKSQTLLSANVLLLANEGVVLSVLLKERSPYRHHEN